jgi:hypothetical protein
MHKQHPQTAYRKYAVLIDAIFENCDKKSRQPILKLPTSFEAIGTVHQFICDGVKRPAWRTISANQPNHNRKVQHKCNAQQHHQKFFHSLFSYLTYFSAPIIRIGLDGMVVHPIQTHKKGTLHSHFECTVFLLSSFKVGSFTKLNLAF